jgi:hypothetical protein
MTQQPVPTISRLTYLAYRLGSLPIRAGAAAWKVIYCAHSGYPDREFLLKYKFAIKENLEAVAELSKLVPQDKADLTRHARAALHQEYESYMALPDPHPEKLHENIGALRSCFPWWDSQLGQEGKQAPTDKFAPAQLAAAARERFFVEAITPFCDVLRDPYRTYTHLGRAVYLVAYGVRDDELPEDLANLNRVLSEIREVDPRLGDLDCNLSEAAFSRRISPRRSGAYHGGPYSGWVRYEVEMLEADILDRLQRPQSPEVDKTFWVKASEALRLAEGWGYALSLPDINKYAKKGAFLSRNPSSNRREVDLRGFLDWLRIRPKADQEPTTKAEIEGIETRTKQERAKKERGRSNLA